MSTGEDKVARAVSVLSLAVAILGVAVPYFQQRFQQSEQFKAELEPHGLENYRLTGVRLAEHGHVVQSRWKLVLSNVGSQKLSIAKYELANVGARGNLQYSGLDGGLWDAQGAKVQLPIVLEGGETKIIHIDIGELVSHPAFTVLSGAATANQIPVSQGNLLLARRGIDLYGNAVVLREFDSNYSVEWKNPSKPTYRLDLISGRGNTFRTSASP